MSWLSELFGGGGGEDPRAVQQRAESAAREAQARQDAMMREQQASAERQHQAQLEYLNQLRADQLVEQERQRALDPTATRQAAMSALGGYFTPGFEESFIGGGATDPYEEAVYGEQRSAADEYIENLLKRQVITPTGATAARGELEKQAPRVRSQLQDIGDVLIGQGRGRLGEIAGRGREAASQLGVNQPFDITPYQTQSQGALSEFQSGLSDRFRANVTGDLFDVSGLGAIAGGAGGGAGSGIGVPTELLPGTVTPSDETDPFTGQKPPQKRTATVF